MIMNYVKFNSITSIEIIALLIIFISIIFLIFEPKLNKRKLLNKNEHGSSKFADMNEIKKTFIKEKVNGGNNVGFPVWYEKKNGKFDNVYLDNKSPHFLLIGSTGSGKSVTVVIPECFMFATSKEKHSVVVTDPKGEIFRTTSKVFADNGYDIVTIDFRDPSKSKRINIMQPIIDEWKKYCKHNKTMLFLFSHFIKVNKIKINKLNDPKYINKIKDKYNIEDYLIDIIINNEKTITDNINNKKMYENDYFDNSKELMESKTNEELVYMIREYQNSSSKYQAETNRLVISLGDLIFVDKDSSDKFWINSAKQLFIGIVGIFLEDYKLGLIGEEKINISSVKKFQNSSLIKENQTFLQRNINNRQYGNLSKDYLTSILSSAENTYKSIIAVFGEKMAIFDDLNVENITSTNEFNFTDLGSKPVSLFIIVPDEDRAYFQLVTIIIGMLTKDLTKFANLPENNGTLPVKVEWILDEFANCPPLSSIETLVSVARSRGMRFQFFIQSFSQLNQVYGKEIASIIQDNCALVYLKTNTVETAEIINKKLGKETIETNSMSNSMDAIKKGGSKTTSLIGKELLSVTEIIGLKYKTIIFPTVSNPIFRDTYLYSDIYPEFKNIGVYERQSSVLKRITSNYYTVEQLRKNYRNLEDENETTETLNMANKFQREINRSMRRVNEIYKEDEEINNNSIASKIVNEILFNCETKINMISNDSYLIKINQMLSSRIIKNIQDYDKENYSISVSTDLKRSITNIMIWNNLKEKEIR